MGNLTQELKEKAKEFGATVVGIADATLYKEAPEGHRPEDILNGAENVLSMGFLQPKSVIEKSMPTQYTRNIFTVSSFADQVAHRMALWLENKAYEAIPVSARGLYMDAMAGELRGDLSHKHTAMLAGLGEIGVNTLLIHPKFGPHLMLVSIVTNAPLKPDSPFAESLCPRSKCMKCVTACPVKAISPSGEINRLKCVKYYRQHSDIYFETWGLYFCRECRKVCSIPE
jgi:epoxyqueuosine reductase